MHEGHGKLGCGSLSGPSKVGGQSWPFPDGDRNTGRERTRRAPTELAGEHVQADQLPTKQSTSQSLEPKQTREAAGRDDSDGKKYETESDGFKTSFTPRKK